MGKTRLAILGLLVALGLLLSAPFTQAEAGSLSSPGFVGRMYPTGQTARNAETRTLIAAMDVRPSPSHQKAIDVLIGALKDANVWARLDVLQVYAMHTSQAALLNWKQTGANGTAVNSPVFTPFGGFNGDGATSYLNLNYNPATFGGAKLLQNDASLHVFVTTNVAESVYDAGGFATNGVQVNSRSATDNFNHRLNNGTIGTTAGATDSRGLTSINRLASGNYRIVKNGVLVDTRSVSSAAVPNLNFYGLGFNNNGTPAGLSTKRVAVIAAGGGLSDSETLALYNALNTYLTAVGAI